MMLNRMAMTSGTKRGAHGINNKHFANDFLGSIKSFVGVM
jgi:hypothetical protein